MRLAVTVVFPATRRSADIVLDADPATPMAAVAAAIGRLAGTRAEPLYVDCQRISSRLALAQTPVRDGCVISVGGPDGCLAPYSRPDAALYRSQDGIGFDFNRPPRLLPPQPTARFTLPVPPAAQERRPLPILMAVLPLVMGVAMAYFLHQVYLLAMAGLSPVMLIGSALSERKGGRKATAARLAEYTEHKARIERDARAALDAERIARREQCPDPAATLAIASGPRRRLWERRRTDPDYLLLRVGTADLPSTVDLTDPEQDEHRRKVVWSLPDAPVTIPLAERGVIGVAGPADAARSVGRWLVAYAATLHSPNDLRIYLLTNAAGRASWDWVRWLPHCRPAAAAGPGGTGPGAGAAAAAAASCVAQVGNDAESVATRVAELLAIVAQRQQERDDRRDPVRFRTDIMVVLDGSRKLRSLPGVIQLLSEGPQVGVYAICLDHEERLLPAECQAVAVLARDGLRVQQMRADTVLGVRPDHADPGWCARLARAIAPIRDVSDDEEAAGLPAQARLLDVLDLEPPTASAIADRWRAGGRATRVLVGESYDGPFGIDIRKDGPHGLVAGTTGSGKSELLQTIVAALAVANRPDEMTFVLIDYKGGSAFADCARLPHTVGMVTDLDRHQVERALTSLSAELTRRERLLARVGAKDIEGYQHELDSSRSEGERLPRLVIVIDEFASMVRELPDFVTGLVNIAQRGRSLGIHLILATQRPSGVVSADIRANTNLRIALRVTDPAESADVIDATDAARIAKANPGRAYVRLGHASLVPFQAGRVGGPRPVRPAPPAPPSAARSARASDSPTRPRWAPDRRISAGPLPPNADPRGGRGTRGAAPSDATQAGNQPLREVLLTSVDWADLGRPEPVRSAAQQRADAEITDLEVLVEQVGIAAAELRIPASPSPWLPPLPASVQLGDIGPKIGETTVPFGLMDVPERQLQQPADLSLRTFSHLLAAGAPRSGRSQLLRTIAGALALAHGCADVHLYGLDGGNGALLPVAELPHCGAVVGRNERERATRLLRRLDAELTRRQEVLAAGGFTDVTEQRAATGADDGVGSGLAGVAGLAAASGASRDAGQESPLPHIFLLLDRWEGFTATLGEADGGALTEVITRVLTEGASAGVHLVMTGDRTMLAGRIASLCEEKLVFRLAEREDYALAGLRPRAMPDDPPPGRAFRAVSGVEVQVALLGPDPSGQGQAAALRSIAATCALRYGSVTHPQRPFRVDAAPARITFEQAWALRPTGPGPVAASAPSTARVADALWGLVGVGGDSVAPLGPDLGVGVPAFVVAGPGGSGRSTILVAMARSFLASGTPVALIAPRPSPLLSLSEAHGVRRMLAAGAALDPDSVAAAVAALDGPGVVLIDDAELLRDCDDSGELSRLVASGTDRGQALVFAGDPEAGLCAGFGGWQVEAKRARRGVLTAPGSLPDGELIGARLTRAMIGQRTRPGRCLLNVGDGNLVTVTVPLG